MSAYTITSSIISLYFLYWLCVCIWNVCRVLYLRDMWTFIRSNKQQPRTRQTTKKLFFCFVFFLKIFRYLFLYISFFNYPYVFLCYIYIMNDFSSILPSLFSLSLSLSITKFRLETLFQLRASSLHHFFSHLTKSQQFLVRRIQLVRFHHDHFCTTTFSSSH